MWVLRHSGTQVQMLPRCLETWKQRQLKSFEVCTCCQLFHQDQEVSHEGKALHLTSLNCTQWKISAFHYYRQRSCRQHKSSAKRRQVDAAALNIISWQWLLPMAAASHRQNCWVRSFCCDASSLPAADLFLDWFLTRARCSSKFITASGTGRSYNIFSWENTECVYSYAIPWPPTPFWML